MQENKTGILYVVATPIGNLQDITYRAVEILKSVDKIAVEDTRHSAPLLKHLSVDKPTLCLHEFNEQKRLGVLLDYLCEGESIALISDAGTPLISDPGYRLVHEARAEGITVVPVPGACAAITALCASGLPTDRFTFEGFLPPRDEARANRLKQLLHESRTMVFYEAPHRLLSSLQTMAEVFGDKRVAVVARELTKIYESILSDSLPALVEYYAAHPNEQRGEIVIMVTGEEEREAETREVVPEDVLALLMEQLPLKQAVTLASKITGERKNVLYDLALIKKG